jgi:hypothetical protein
MEIKRVALALIFLLSLTACGGQPQPPAQPAGPVLQVTAKDVPPIGAGPQVTSAPKAATDVPAIGAGPQLTPAGTALPIRLMDTKPSNGSAGDSFMLSGDGFTPGKSLEFTWVTADGSYNMVASPENVEFHDKKFVEKRISLGNATVDSSGRVSATFKAPDDYGETHDIYAMADGQQVGKGGYRITRKVSISPESGSLGTPISIKVTGLGWKVYESTIAIRYDNSMVGIGTAVTTKGATTIVIRASGRPGKHVIDIDAGAKSVPYLNNQQSGTAYILDSRFTFTLTDDKQIPQDKLDWPDPSRVAKTANGAAPTGSASTVAVSAPTATKAVFEPATGPILSKPVLKASNLPPNSAIDVYWVTARGNRVSPSGWSLNDTQITSVKVGADGNLAAPIDIPDDLGGWHSAKLVQGDKLLAEVPFYIERSILEVTPKRVKAGEVFTIHLKGIGWTELDNGVTVDYDNTFIGFACGFNSGGDVQMMLVATGGAGIHLLDLYPMIYQGHGQPPWGYQVPILTFADDFPGLSLGYKLPAMRLAIEVYE